MSTRIDIQIGQALLMDRLRGVAGLNREQRLERERQAKEQAQIKAAAGKAAADRAKAGAETDADKAQRKSGVPEYYTPPKVAAMGQALPAWLLMPSGSDFKAKVRGIPAFQFTEAYLQDPADQSSSHFSLFSATGPNGGNCIRASTVPTGNPTINANTYSSRLTAETAIDSEPVTKGFTFEMMGKIATPGDTDGNEFSFVTASALHGFCQITLSHSWRKVANPSTYAQMGSLSMTCVRTVSTSPNGYQNFSYTAAGASNLFVSEVQPALNDYSQWHHVAIVQESTGGTGRELRFYFNGAKVAALSLANAALGTYLNIFSPSFDDAIVAAAYGDDNAATLETTSSSVHGVRFTSRALYRGETYTPPASLTTLA
jgi:hypothetical protein